MPAKSTTKKNTAAETTIEQLSKNLREGNLKNLYVFYGPEEYLKDFYINQIKKHVIEGNDFACSKFEGKVSPETLKWECESLPMFGEKKILIIRNSGLFKSKGQAKTSTQEEESEEADDRGTKETGKDAFSFLEELPPYCYVIFKESDVDKRSKMYKTILGAGCVLNCEHQTEDNIKSVLKKTAERNGRTITQNALSLLISGVTNDITGLLCEMEKLILFTQEGGAITDQDVRKVCELSFQSKIFDLTDAVGEGNHGKALSILENLLSAREPAQLILTMIGRQYLQLYHVKKLTDKRASSSEICSQLGILEFVARKLIKQANFFTAEQLFKKAMFCLEMDEAIKNGMIKDVAALELLVSI